MEPLQFPNQPSNNNIINNSHKAVPFITFDNESKKFVISTEAREIISRPEYKKVGMISLVGRYRTGKSFLLNRVLINDKSIKNGFDVGPTIKPCTKGIWLWSTPLIISNNHSKDPFPAFLIDTEGLGAYDEEINHDSKIFLIAILISSLFIYNSFGTIDENAINSLSLILNLSKSIKLRDIRGNNNNTGLTEEEEMAKYFPSLLWLLRDFVLKLEDSEGNVITAKQYLENALMLQKGSSTFIEEKNIVRKLIKTYFPERDCFPMVRPVENENDLQNLQTLPNDKIRSEFLMQSETLRNKVLRKTKPKNFNGKILSGEMLLELVESVIKSINEGVIPVIENSWKYVISNECLKNISQIILKYKEKIRQFQKENIDKVDFFTQLEIYHNELVKKFINQFTIDNSVKFDDIGEYISKLKSSLNMEYRALNEENSSLLKDKYSTQLKEEINMILNNDTTLMKLNYSSFISELIQIRDKIDSLIPDFPSKSQICFEMILDAIKKYIENYLIKNKKEIESQLQSVQNENDILKSKLQNISDEYLKDKKEFTDQINKCNEIIIEHRLKEKSHEEKIKNFELEKKNIKETNERSIHSLRKEFEAKLENYKMDIHKMKNELQTKEEEIIVIKLNNEKVRALDEQKITFLQKEIEQWKERYSYQGQDIIELKTELSNINTENEKLKEDKKELEHKLLTNNNNKDILSNSLRFSYNEFPPSNSNNSILKTILNEQFEIKELITKLSETTNEFVNKNKELISSNKNNGGDDCNNNKKQLSPSISVTKKEELKKELNLFTLSNNTETKKKKLYIKITDTIFNKDELGKPYLEYICEISKSTDKPYTVNKRFTQFADLNKELKNLFKNLIVLPDTGSLFININDMTGNSFHENKIQQLDKYVKDLLNIDVVAQSAPFKSFFLLNENNSKVLIPILGEIKENNNSERATKSSGIKKINVKANNIKSLSGSKNKK